MSISAAADKSTAPTALLPVKVKLLSCGRRSRSGSPALPTPRAMPMRSQTRKTQTAKHLRREERAPPERQVSFVPGHPIDKKQDVPAFLLHHRLEGIDESRRKKSRAFGQREQTEGKEAVDAFAETGHHEGPFRIARAAVFRLRRQADPVRLDEIGKNFLVPPFLEAVELDGAPQQCVLDRLGIAQHAQAGLPLGLHGDVPNRQADEAVARLRRRAPANR